jgi:hypothetical protein
MNVVSEETPKVSPYLAAGSPNRCFLPSCHKSFVQSCFHGRDGHYYCSEECAELGARLDMSHVEELRTKLSAHMPTPKQKLLGSRQ